VVVAGQGDHLPDDSPTPNAVNVDDQMDRKADSFSRARMRKADVGRQHAMRQGVLKAFFNWCIAQGFAASNPVCKVKLFNDNNERCRYLKDEEWERLRTAAPAHEDHSASCSTRWSWRGTRGCGARICFARSGLGSTG
jgi:site-specific recombinase XerD